MTFIGLPLARHTTPLARDADPDETRHWLAHLEGGRLAGPLPSADPPPGDRLAALEALLAAVRRNNR